MVLDYFSMDGLMKTKFNCCHDLQTSFTIPFGIVCGLMLYKIGLK